MGKPCSLRKESLSRSSRWKGGASVPHGARIERDLVNVVEAFDVLAQPLGTFVR